MGAFKIQTDLDLSGFNLLNFCIQSYTDLENVPNLGLGRKLFFTGNSTDEKNLREVIWNGVEWKAAVYLDDIEALTNGEGSLGTRVKALEDMLNVDSAETVVSTWAEIQAFLDNVKEGTDLMTMLDGKLDKTGGTISSTDFRPLAINSSYVANDVGTVRVELRHNNSIKGHFGWDSNFGLHFYNNKSGVYLGIADSDGTPFCAAYGEINPLLHSGNVGEYAVKYDNGASVDAARHSIGYDNGNRGSENLPIGQGGGGYISFGHDSYGGQLLGTSNGLGLYYRGVNNNAFSAWRTIAFTDSDITGNAATATKLKNKVSLWGNEFDGTQSLNGDMKFANNTALYIQTSDKTAYRNLFYYDTSNTLFIGRDAGENGERVSIFGSPLVFGTSRASIAMTITEERNVLVGASYIPYTLPTPKMSIHGGLLCVQAVGSVLSLNSLPDRGLVLGGKGHTLSQYLENNGNFAIQAHYTNDGTTRALNLNPLGGAVNVGEGGLSVAGIASVATTLTVGKSDGTTAATIYLQRASANYIWANNAGGSIHLGVKDAGNLGNHTASLSIHANNVRSGLRNNEVSLGLASYRWSDVYSVNGDFSGRVLIGGAADDENYGLIAKGGVRFYDSSITDYLIKGGDAIVKLQDTYASSFRFVYGLQIGQEQKAAFGFAGTVSNPFAFIGQNSTKWFAINSTESVFNVLTKFNAGALIPTGQTLTIGSVTIRETAAGEVEVDGNLHTTGTLASGGKAAVGEGDNGGGGNANVYSDVLEGVITQEWEVGNPFQKEDVIVSLYMWNTDESRWEMVLADIGVTSENIWVTFGRPTSTTDKYMAVVMG